MKPFDDHFSKQAAAYARHRPTYPPELFAYLASLAPRQQLAWDCGTGNGQAALELARHFDRVVATDASEEQIARAMPHERVEYRVERAEDTTLAPGSVDLVTVAVAVHWFDLEPFYAAVRRVASANGVLAVWTYQMPVIDPAVDELLLEYSQNVLAGYWPERIRYLNEHYKTLPFPFEEITPPTFEIQLDWELAHLAGFLESWSATQRFMQANGAHPLQAVWERLVQAWGGLERTHTLRWPLHLRVGRVSHPIA